MFELIARLRLRPIEYRRRVAFWTACVITMLIIIAWLVSLSVRFDADPEQATSAVPSSAPGPLETFGAQLKSGFAAFGDIFNSR